MKVYLLSSSMRAILACSRANLIPIQMRGPKPNGMWLSGGLLAFSSAVNLSEKIAPSCTLPYQVPYSDFMRKFSYVKLSNSNTSCINLCLHHAIRYNA